MIEVLDDFLDPSQHEDLCNYFMGNYDAGDIANSCCWIFNDGISYKGDGHFQHIHQIFSNHTIISPAWPLVKPILEKEEAIAIARIKANSITRTEELMVFEHAFHCDFAPTMSDLTTAIYYINTCDGYTLFEDGTKVESVTNRLLKFPSNMKHTGTSCTDRDRRILINFNYLSGRVASTKEEFFSCLQQDS